MIFTAARDLTVLIELGSVEILAAIPHCARNDKELKHRKTKASLGEHGTGVGPLLFGGEGLG